MRPRIRLFLAPEAPLKETRMDLEAKMETTRSETTISPTPASETTSPSETSPPANDVSPIESPSDPASEASPSPAKKRRTRRGKKRVVFKPPQRFAAPVRALWKTASPEQQNRAHRRCVVMLEYWLGRISKQQAAEKLSLPVLRIWQLSQMALSGMLAGLLEQPKWRGGDPMPRSDESRELLALRKQVRELEDKLTRTESLVRLLRDLPLARELSPPGVTDEPRKKSPKKLAKRARGKKEGPSGAPSTAGSDSAGDVARGGEASSTPKG